MYQFEAIRKANYEKCNIYPVKMFCYIKLHSWGQKLLLSKHDECEHKKRLYSVHNTKHILPFVILNLNAEVGGLSMRLKIKKKKIKIKTTKPNRKQQQKLYIIAKLGFEPRPLAWKAKIIATGVLYHMSS